MNILVVRLDAIGDMVLMSPFLRELRRGQPKAHITLLVSSDVLNLIELCPYVDETVTKFDWRWILSGKIDWAISPRFDEDHYQANRLLILSRAKRQIRYRDKWRFKKEPRHEVERNLNVLATIGVKTKSDKLESWLSSADQMEAKRVWSAEGIRDEEIVVAMIPGARHEAKQWPVKKYLTLGMWLIEKYQVKILLLGGKDEHLLASTIKAGLRSEVVDMTGLTTLREASALLARCKLYVGNDTGLMHMAAAQKIPVVMISRHQQGADKKSRSSPVRFRPWGVSHQVVQPKGGDISSILVEDVQHAVTTLDWGAVSDTHAKRDGKNSIKAGI